MSRLARWTPITHEDYKVRLAALCSLLPKLSSVTLTEMLSKTNLQELPYTRHVSDVGLAKETDMFFMAVVERGTGT